MNDIFLINTNNALAFDFFEKAKNAPKRHVAMLSFKKGAYHDI